MIRKFRLAERSFAILTMAAVLLGGVPAFPQFVEAATVTVFEDGFETQDFTNWTAVDEGNAAWDAIGGGGSGSSDKKARASGISTDVLLTKAVSTVGYQDIEVSFDHKDAGLETGDYVVVEYSPDGGSNWVEIETFDENNDVNDNSSNAWVPFSDSLGSDANNNNDFQLRFRASLDANSDTFDLDSVVISGNEITVDPEVPACSSTDDLSLTTFDTFTLGSVDDQNSWSADGPYDQEVVSNTYGFTEFGCKSLRISNAVTSGAFGNQTFAAPTTNEAGESTVASNNHFEAQFDIASTMLAEQPGLALSVSPDDGNGSRMSYLSFTDTTDGIDVVFYDVTNAGPLPSATSWNDTEIATLDRDETHTIKFEMDFVDGPANDVVKIYINGSLVHTGTSWEDYYRYDAEQNGNGNVLFPVDTLIFRAGGTAVPSTDGNGYLFDNMSLSVSNVSEPEPETETIIITGDTAAGENQPGWLFNRDTNTATPFEFNTDQAATGTGSIYVLPIGANAGDKFIAEFFALTEMGDIESLSYDFNIGTGGDASDENEFYLNVYANFGDSTNPTTNFYDCRYNVVPTTGVVGDWTTVTFDPEDTYSVAKWGGSTSPHACPSSPADMGDDAVIRAFAINLGDTSNNDTGLDGYFDNVVFETATKITTYDFEPAPTATVTMCKEDQDGDPRSGWTLMLRGDQVEDVVVPANNVAGIDTTNLLTAGLSYIANVAGTWLNNREPDNYVDAEYSTEDDWVTHMNGFDGYGENILELQVAQNFMNWGSYNSAHEYAAAFVPSTTGVVNFRIFDGNDPNPEPSWYGDNSGSLNVSIDEGYAGVTGKDGCIIFEDVPYGTYKVDEIAQDGWVNVSGLGEVVVDSEEETFTVVNTDDPQQCVDQLEGDWADNVWAFSQGKTKGNNDISASRSDENNALGEANWTNPSETGFVSLGFRGSITVSFNSFVPNVAGDDISIYEATNGDGSYPDETAKIEVSQDGESWHEVGTATNNDDGVTSFNFNSTGLDWIKFVRITDTTDAGSHDNNADGFDVDAVKAMQTVCTEPEDTTEASLVITDPDTDYETIFGTYIFKAEYVDADENFDPIRWAIRSGTCDPETNTVTGNVDGFNVDPSWDGASFSVAVDMSSWPNGNYCFVVNPVEDGIPDQNSDVEGNLRETRWFTLNNPVVVACEVDVNLLANASFEEPDISNQTDGWELVEPVAWLVEKVGSTVDTLMEIQRGNTGQITWSASDGFQMIELDGSEASDFSQTIPTIEDKTYTLSWDFSARPGRGTSDNQLEVLINGVEKASAMADGTGLDDTDWTTGSYTFVGDGNDVEIKFADGSSSNGYGGLLDNVSLTCDPNTGTIAYCGDGEVSGWEQCELGDEGCNNSCQLANQCHDDKLVKITLDDTTSSSGSWNGKAYLGATDKIAPNGYWFSVDEFGAQTAASLAGTGFEGLAIDYDGSQMRFAWRGENAGQVIDYIQGELEFLGFDDIVNDDITPEINGTNFKLESSGQGFPDVFDPISSSTIEFDMRADVGNDGVTLVLRDGEMCAVDPETYEVFGYVWNDEDESGDKNGAEEYRSGVEVSISNGTTTTATTTDAGGYYFFNVEGGNWTVSATSTGWTFTAPTSTGNTYELTVNATSGPHDFGMFLPGDDLVVSTTNEDDGNSGGGGGYYRGPSNDDEGPTPQIAGVSTGPGFTPTSFPTGGSDPEGQVLGESTSTIDADKQEAVEKLVEDLDGLSGAGEGELAVDSWATGFCAYWWIVVPVWLVIMVGLYWLKNLEKITRKQLVWFNAIFVLLGLIGLAGWLFVSVPCVWWPFAIIAAGSGVSGFLEMRKN